MNTFRLVAAFSFVTVLSNCFILSSEEKVTSGNGYARSELVNSNEVDRDFILDTIRNKNSIVIVELEKSLLEKLKSWIRDDNEDWENTREIILGAFDSNGLQINAAYNDAFRFFQGIKRLRALQNESHNSIPTFHAINELIEQYSTGPILIITNSKPSDENFYDFLLENVMRKNCRVSVLWSGDKEINNYVLFQQLTRQTDGKFGFLRNRKKRIGRNNKFENSDAVKNITNPIEKIRFPDKENSSETTNSGEQQITFFSRFGGMERSVGIFNIPVIVNVASGANLEILSNEVHEIPFIVKNNHNRELSLLFGAKLDGTPQIIAPQRANLKPSSSTYVTVKILRPLNLPSKAASNLTFYVFFNNKYLSRSAIISFVPQNINDRAVPTVNYKYKGNCSEFSQSQNCDKALWGVEFIAQDEESGLLQILTDPYSLVFESDFVAGTKDPVTAHFSATCCNSKVDIWVEDVQGNFIRHSLDVFNQGFSTGEIAAIVVGVLLFLFILIAIIVAFILFRKRNKRNMIIPRLRTESR